MAKVYKDLNVPLSQLKDFAFEKVKPEVTSLMIEDLAEPNNGYVPYMDGDLTDSIFKASSPLEGIVGHSTPYAARKYFEGSLTGVKKWNEVYWKENKEEIIETVIKGFEFK